jgi:hypothetical protein
MPLDVTESLEEARRKRDKAVYTDHLDTTDTEDIVFNSRRSQRRGVSRQRLLSESSDEGSAPPLKTLAIESKCGF